MSTRTPNESEMEEHNKQQQEKTGKFDAFLKKYTQDHPGVTITYIGNTTVEELIRNERRN